MIEDISIFVLMPFGKNLSLNYHKFIEAPLKEKGFMIQRADDIFRPTSIIDDIKTLISNADIIIAELTGKNPNVFYELGIAHQQEKYVILICQEKEDVPFDLSHIRTIFYKPNPSGYSKLINNILKYMDVYISEKNFNDDNLTVNFRGEQILKSDAHVIKMLENQINEAFEIVDYIDENSNFENLIVITNHRVKGLRIHKSSINQLPNEVTNLVKLEKLILYNNKIVSLPENIGNLVSLEVLDVEFNQLTQLPHSIYNLHCLERLNLGENEIFSISESIGNLFNLHYLNLDGNNLDNIPYSIGKLKMLEGLSLGDNKLSFLPKSGVIT